LPGSANQATAADPLARAGIAGKRGIKQLFDGRLAAITPLIWVINVCILMAYYAISSWLPTLLNAAHRPASSAALFGMVFQIGGTLGGLVLCRWIDKGKVVVIAAAFACALPFVATIMYAVDSDTALFLTVFLAGFCVMSIQYGINAVGALTYDRAIRSLGLGCSFAVSRLGAIVGPLLVSASLELGLAPVRSFLVACLPLGVGCVAALFLARRWSITDDTHQASLSARMKPIAPPMR
jgi:AAHS family 4-hydroxybenzoate transporter-like MFS transporter